MTDRELLNCLTDRPCDVCKFHGENGCSQWTCVFCDGLFGDMKFGKETSGDLISREAVLDLTRSLTRWCVRSEDGKFNNVGLLYDDVMFGIYKLPSATPQEPKTGHCKDCKYFEYDSVTRVEGIPLIVAHEICSRWGDGCKTRENGYCFLFEPQESEVNNG